VGWSRPGRADLLRLEQPGPLRDFAARLHVDALPPFVQPLEPPPQAQRRRVPSPKKTCTELHFRGPSIQRELAPDAHLLRHEPHSSSFNGAGAQGTRGQQMSRGASRPATFMHMPPLHVFSLDEPAYGRADVFLVRGKAPAGLAA
jgi:hypothetical protein